MIDKSQAVDNFQPRFGQMIVLVHQSESAGATSNDVVELVTLLNGALELNGEALKLTAPSDAQKRAQLLAQVDEIFASVEDKAAQIQAVASQRTFTKTVVTYISGATAAFLGTIGCAYGISFLRGYRIKRTFQMKISPK